MLFSLASQSCTIVETVAVTPGSATTASFGPLIPGSVTGTVLGARRAQEAELVQFLLGLFLADEFSCSHSVCTFG